MRGNVVDMAVGIIIGGAFGKIITSLVNDIIMPPIGMLIGGVDFKNLAWVLKPATLTTTAVAINYGAFINTLIDFIIIAFAIFMMIKMVMRFQKKKEEAPVKAAPVQPSEEVKLLREIRDSLKKKA